MQAIAVNDTVVLAKNNGPEIKTKRETDGFDLAMAAMVALLMPDSGAANPDSSVAGEISIQPAMLVQPPEESGSQNTVAADQIFADNVEQKISAATAYAPVPASQNNTAVYPAGEELQQVVLAQPQAVSQPEAVPVSLPEDALTAAGEKAPAQTAAPRKQENRPPAAEAGSATAARLNTNVVVQPEAVPVSLPEDALTAAGEKAPAQTAAPRKQENRPPAAEAGSTTVSRLNTNIVVQPQAMPVSQPEAALAAAGEKAPVQTAAPAQADGTNTQETVAFPEGMAVDEVRQESGSNTSTTTVPLVTNNHGVNQPMKAPESTNRVALPDLKKQVGQEIMSFLARDRSNGQKQIRLRLEPEHLGQLTIQLFFDRDELSAYFYTGNNHVKEILESSLSQLRDALSQQDLKLNEALVFTDDSESGNMARNFEERNEKPWFTPTSPKNGLYANPQVEPADVLPAVENYAQVNYLI